MVACTFNSVTVDVSEIESITPVGAYEFACSLKCQSDTSSNLASLQALQGRIGTQVMASGKVRIQTVGGTKGSLVLKGITYPNCYISGLTWRYAPKSKPSTAWYYTVSFVQETI